LFFGVPTIYVRLIDPAVIPDALAAELGRSARLFVSGSAPLPSHVLHEFAKKFGHTILERYGMSEALMITTNPYEGERRAGSVGFPFPGVDIKLLDEKGGEVGNGEVGEVVLRSPHLFSGYWRNAAATRNAFTNGFFRSGDVGTISADGYLTLRGRRGDMIISGGFNVYPREIEELLLEDPRVREVAVAGAPDALRGEVPIAYIVADLDCDLEDLRAHCQDHLARYKVPDRFIRVESLPRTALGKVQKHLLASTASFEH
jgi:malonyl-CoA/methylmalonyl-CoA synthetase